MNDAGGRQWAEGGAPALAAPRFLGHLSGSPDLHRIAASVHTDLINLLISSSASEVMGHLGSTCLSSIPESPWEPELLIPADGMRAVLTCK